MLQLFHCKDSTLKNSKVLTGAYRGAYKLLTEVLTAKSYREGILRVHTVVLTVVLTVKSGVLTVVLTVKNRVLTGESRFTPNTGQQKDSIIS